MFDLPLILMPRQLRVTTITDSYLLRDTEVRERKRLGGTRLIEHKATVSTMVFPIH